MKLGRSIQAVAGEIQLQESVKADYIAPSSLLSAVLDHTETRLRITRATGTPLDLAIAETAHNQLATRLDIPRQYYDRMRTEAPGLWQQSVTEWLHQSPDRRMIRTLGGRVRAVLSDRYRRMDHTALMAAVLPTLGDMGTRIVSSEMTDRRLYLKAIFPSTEIDVPMGDRRVGEAIRAGVVISNSEIGEGAESVKVFIEILRCANGMILPEYGTRRAHVGRRAPTAADGDSDGPIQYSDETLRADDRAHALRLRDTIRTLGGEGIRDIAARRIAAASGQPLPDPAGAVEELAKAGSITEGEGVDVLRHLIQGGDVSTWGLIQAVTRSAQDVPDYDRATELEALGGVMLFARTGGADLQ